MDTKSRSSILIEARKWLGTPYHHKGRVLGVGVDCGGLLYEVYGKFFQLKPFPDNYAQDWTMHQHNELYLDFISEYVKETLTPEIADIVVFKYAHNYSHGGIITNKGVIHAWGRTAHGSVIESSWSFFNDKGAKRLRKYFKVAI